MLVNLILINLEDQLLNYGGRETDGYPTPQGMEGINIDLHYLEQSVIRKTQFEGKSLSVWYWTETEEETTKAYNKLFGLTGNKVDFFYSDDPLEAMKARDLI